MRAECTFCQRSRTPCPTPQACAIDADAAWMRFHKRMTRITAGALLVALFGTLYLLAL